MYSLPRPSGASATSMALSSAGRSSYSTRTCRAAARARASVSATTMPMHCVGMRQSGVAVLHSRSMHMMCNTVGADRTPKAVW